MGFFKSPFGGSTKPPTPEQFAEIVTEAVRRAGETRSWTFDSAEFRLVYAENGKESRILNLANLHIEYCALPAGERKAWLKRTAVAMINPMELPEDFEDVRPDLMPSIRPRAFLEHMRLDALIKGNAPLEMAHLALTDHLVICLVYDLPTSMRFVMHDQIENWGITLYEALEVAMQNLAERDCPMMALGDKLYIIETGDSYDATRLLMKDRVQRLEFNGLPVALPLSRNTLFMTGSDDVEGLGIMADLAEKKAYDARSLCPIPAILRDGEWETWLPPADHPHFEAYHLFELKYLNGEYAEQKVLLEKRNEQTETDVFVASFSAIERDDKVRSWTTWSKDVPTWLPKTDYIALFNPETEATRFAKWDRVVSVVGDRMAEREFYPPRWSVEDFPSVEELERIGVEVWGK